MPQAFGRREEKRLVCAFRNLEPSLKSQGRLFNDQLLKSHKVASLSSQGIALTYPIERLTKSFT
jgi:hypothetical protein